MSIKSMPQKISDNYMWLQKPFIGKREIPSFISYNDRVQYAHTQ
jgi:hypothetical protein